MNFLRCRETSLLLRCASRSSALAEGSGLGTAVNLPRHLNVQNRIGTRGTLQIPIWQRHFSTSQPRLLHPLIWTVVRPVAKFTAILVGRSFRKWWRALPKDKKGAMISKLNRNKTKVLVSFIVLFGACVAYHEAHVQAAPFTGRRRFVAFDEKQIQELADFQLELLREESGDHLLPPNHPQYRRVETVADKLIQSNQDIREIHGRKWTVFVIDDPIQNAFVLPNGNIFVYVGMLDACDNDDQLGVILGHEMAHTVLGHGAETVSYTHLLEMLTIVLVAAIWAVVPADFISILVHWLMKTSVNIFLHFPFSRVLEVEADKIGLMMSAKACFDVRESVTFWTKMDVQEKESGFKSTEWLSTHPNHDARSLSLEKIVPHMLMLREQCNCPILPKKISPPPPKVPVPKRSAVDLEKPSTTT